MKDRRLILIRHAHRDTSEGRDRDDGLSEKGKEQAKAVSKYFRSRYGKAEPLLLSSPKVRCIETLLPLSDKLKADVKILDLLDEQHEPEKAYTQRVEKFFRWWKQRAPELVIACSHGDWIPFFVRHSLGATVDLKKGGWLEIESREGQLHLVWILQKLP
jgi:broad specificity phosphatase PhoE